jgi:hypothetical protein
MDSIKQLQAELKTLFDKISKSKRLNRQEKKMMRGMAREMSADLFSDFDEMTENGHTNRTDKKPPSEFFREFALQPEKKESLDIRKIFLRLATRFHPDKARNKKEQDILHERMQRINEAYKNGDIAALLEIEAQYTSLDSFPAEETTGLAEFLQKQIDATTQEIELLQSQLVRVASELKNINYSEVGRMHMQSKKRDNPLHEITAGMDETIESLTMLRDGLKEFLETGVMPDFLMQELQPEETIEIDFDELLDALIQMEEQQQRNKRKKKRT